MEDVKTYEDRKTMVMEGMYKGMAGKIDEVRQSVSKELQFSSAQQASAYEALAGSFKQGVEGILAELRYLSQQNSAIYDYNQKERDHAKDALLEAVRACNEQIAALEARVNEKIEAIQTTLSQEIAQKLAALEEQRAEEARAAAQKAEEAKAAAAKAEESKPEEASAESVRAAEPVNDETFEYDVLAEKIASVMPEVDYDMLVDKVAAAVPATDPDAVAAAVLATIPQVDENAIADRVAESVPLVDYDLVAERVASVMENEFDVTVDENGIEKIASAVAEGIDYEKIAVRVAELLKEQGAYAVSSAPVAEPVAEQTEQAEEQAAESAEAVEAPASEPEETQPAEIAQPAEEAEEAEEPAEAAPAREELAAASAAIAEAKPAYTPVVVPVPDDPSLMTRFKRSFKAKIIESTEEIKNYYFDLKNAFLSYARVNSQVSWSNDRFTYAGDTIAKIGVRGKTLCLYVALNPDEFPSSVYHQKFAGDTKMYEKTPMMIKIKSGVAVKRGIRLIEMLMENLGAVRDEGFVPVDYADEFAFRSEEQLLAEGLIKTAIVEKSDLDF